MLSLMMTAGIACACTPCLQSSGGRYQHAEAVAHAPSVLQGGCRQCIMLHHQLTALHAVAVALTLPVFQGGCIHRTRMNAMSAKRWLV
jgi:hypothetical protein